MQSEITEVQIPPRGTQCREILEYLQSGRTLTVAKAMSDLSVYALSQRVGELKRMGWPIQSRPLKIRDKCVVSEYWMAA